MTTSADLEKRLRELWAWLSEPPTRRPRYQRMLLAIVLWACFMGAVYLGSHL